MTIDPNMTRNEASYAKWHNECDRLVARLAGVDLDALGDGLSRDAYDNDVTVEEYVYERLEEADFPMDALD